MEELRPGLWTWTATHPSWTPEEGGPEGWEHDVRSYAVTGDVLLGGERGFRVRPDSWLAEGLSPAQLRERLQPLLELPVELVLPTHGDPVEDGREALRRALSA